MSFSLDFLSAPILGSLPLSWTPESRLTQLTTKSKSVENSPCLAQMSSFCISEKRGIHLFWFPTTIYGWLLLTSSLCLSFHDLAFCQWPGLESYWKDEAIECDFLSHTCLTLYFFVCLWLRLCPQPSPEVRDPFSVFTPGAEASRGVHSTHLIASEGISELSHKPLFPLPFVPIQQLYQLACPLNSMWKGVSLHPTLPY